MKLIITSIFVFTLSFSNVYASEKKDCSEFQKLTHKYNKCITGNAAGKIKKSTGTDIKPPPIPK